MFDSVSSQMALFDLPLPVHTERPAAKKLSTAPNAPPCPQVEIDIDHLDRNAPDGPLPVIRDLKMPATRGDCRGEGICPMFRCPYNIALRIKAKGSIKVDGGGPGTTMRWNTAMGPKALSRRADRMAEAIVERITELGTSCVLDLVEQHPDGMEVEHVARALGVTEEVVRLDTIEAEHGFDIAYKRAVRRGYSGDAEFMDAIGGILYQIRRRKK